MLPYGAMIENSNRGAGRPKLIFLIPWGTSNNEGYIMQLMHISQPFGYFLRNRAHDSRSANERTLRVHANWTLYEAPTYVFMEFVSA